MDGIIALGHFCETHGPCVILSTQRYPEVPQQKPHSLVIPLCESCRSLKLDQALVSKDENYSYVTTRTPLSQEESFLLRQGTVRSLSCEQEGTLYFGDSERGHVFSHMFNLYDSLARGFQRKYTILVLMKDKSKLLHSWALFVKHIALIAEGLIDDSKLVNQREQYCRNQKSVRQLEGVPSNISRSLPELTGKPGIYAHLHVWFTWLLGCPAVNESVNQVLPKSMQFKPKFHLKTIAQEMDAQTFSKALQLFLTGAVINCEDQAVIETFKSIWPENSPCQEPSSNESFTLIRNNSSWIIDTTLNPAVLVSKLQRNIESILLDANISEQTIELQIAANVLAWINTVNVLIACPEIDLELLHSLNISKNDIPMLSFIISKYSPKSPDKLICNLNMFYQK